MVCLTKLDHEYECPFCWQRVQIILNETLIVGDSNQIDYTKISDKVPQNAAPKQPVILIGSSATAGSMGQNSSHLMTGGEELELEELKP